MPYGADQDPPPADGNYALGMPGLTTLGWVAKPSQLTKWSGMRTAAWPWVDTPFWLGETQFPCARGELNPSPFGPGLKQRASAIRHSRALTRWGTTTESQNGQPSTSGKLISLQHVESTSSAVTIERPHGKSTVGCSIVSARARTKPFTDVFAKAFNPSPAVRE